MAKRYLTILDNPNYKIQATYHYNESNTTNTIILYLHGGGLIFGKRDDLPEEYIQLLLENGYAFLSLDYLLAPESKLEDILQVLNKSLKQIIDSTYHYFNLNNPSFFILGRSAGAYLSLLLAHHLKIENLRGLVLFYGYYTLNDANFLFQNRHFSKYPQVNDKIIQSLISHTALTQEQHPNRYLLYLDARQKGKWIQSLLPTSANLQQYSLSKHDLETLPPALLIHSTNDPDVPYRQSVQMHKFMKEAKLISIDGNEHDFDRTNKTLGFDIYQQVISWLKEFE